MRSEKDGGIQIEIVNAEGGESWVPAEEIVPILAMDQTVSMTGLKTVHERSAALHLLPAERYVIEQQVTDFREALSA